MSFSLLGLLQTTCMYSIAYTIVSVKCKKKTKMYSKY